MLLPMRIKISLGIYLLVSSMTFVKSQMTAYSYERELSGISDQWHKIILPSEVFAKVNPDFSDIRIYGVAEDDTIEASYQLRLAREEKTYDEIAYELLNTSHNEEGFYFTFEIPSSDPINEIKLDFSQENFDWRATLQGSQDLRDWFTIVEDTRIMSISNDHVDFEYSKLTLPSSRYRFFRLQIKSSVQPDLLEATISQSKIEKGSYNQYPIKKWKADTNDQTRETEIEAVLQSPVPVSMIRMEVSDTFDFYRPVTIKYLTDSFLTEQGWKPNYQTLTSEIVNSLEKNDFRIRSTIAQKLLICISNYDNQPLTVTDLELQGYQHELIARFTTKAQYYLVYGNEQAKSPQYDIAHFANSIPENLKILTLGEEVKLETGVQSAITPLFMNKIWLWAIMLLIMLLLGGFSIKMMKKN